MNKRLTITYGDVTLYDEIPEAFNWQESDGRIRIEAGTPAVNPLGQMVQKAMANNANKRLDRGKNGAHTQGAN